MLLSSARERDIAAIALDHAVRTPNASGTR
jgi:hypothetical protein